MAAPRFPTRSKSSQRLNTPPTPGAPAGDFGDADQELLIDGQEEVFSRTEVERGRIEHHTETGGAGGPATASHPDGNPQSGRGDEV